MVSVFAEASSGFSSHYDFDMDSRYYDQDKWAEEHPVEAFNLFLLRPFDQPAVHGEMDAMSSVQGGGSSHSSDHQTGYVDIEGVDEPGPAAPSFWFREDDPKLDYQSQGAGSPFINGPVLGPVTVEHVHKDSPLETIQ